MADTYLLKTFGSAGNRKTFTISVWLKQVQGIKTSTNFVIFSAGSASNTYGQIRYKSGYIQFEDEQGGSVKATPYTNAHFVDPSAWYHLVVRVDTTQSTASDRIRFYRNGSQLSATGTQPDQNEDLNMNNNIGHAIGTLYRGSDSGGHWNGHMAQFIFCDGQSYAPSSFAATDANGIWAPNSSPSITYGSNGFRVDFKGTGASADSSGFGADTSGNNNHFATTNIGTNPSSKDSPEHNFAVFNMQGSNASSITEGGLRMVGDTGTSYSLGGCSSIAFQKGKWYAEFKVGTFDNNYIGLCKEGNMMSNDLDYQYQKGQLFYKSNGNKASGTGSGFGTDTSYGASYTSGDIIGVAADMDNKKLYFSKNGTFQDSGVPTSGSTGTGAAFTGSQISGQADSEIKLNTFYSFFSAGYNDGICQANFGNPSFTISSSNADANGYGSFEYAVPSGYYALCTKNMAQYGG